MATTAVTGENFNDVVKEGTVLLDFWASWCGPCRAFAPVFEKASEKHPDITFGKVDTEASGDLAAAFRIQAIPTLMVFRDGIRVFSQAGALPGPQLEQLIDEVGKLDMDEVRSHLSSEDAGADTK